MNWKHCNLWALSVIAVLSCPIDSRGISLQNRKGIVLQVVAVADSRFTNWTTISQVFQRANELTSTQTNIHIQVLVNYLQEIAHPGLVQGMKEFITDGLYGYWNIPFDLAFIFTSNASTSIGGIPTVPPTACRSDSIVLVNLLEHNPWMDNEPKRFSTEVLAKFVAGSIYQTVFSFDPSSMVTDCKRCSPEHQACLSSNYFLNKDLNDTVCQHIPYELGFCLNKHTLNRGNGTFSSLTIHRNGVKEDGEHCDCFFRQTRCKQTCDKHGKNISNLMTSTTASTTVTTSSVGTTSASTATEAVIEEKTAVTEPNPTALKIIFILVMSASLMSIVVVYVMYVVTSFIFMSRKAVTKPTLDFDTINTVDSSVFVP